MVQLIPKPEPRGLVSFALYQPKTHPHPAMAMIVTETPPATLQGANQHGRQIL